MEKIRWEKLGVVFNPETDLERPKWMVSFAQAPNVIIYDDFVRVFFCCRPEPDAKRNFVSLCGYLDLDRKNLRKVLGFAEKPVMELGGLGEFDEFGTYPVSVIRDGKDILAVFGGWSRCESVPFNISLGMARSTDEGASFKKYGHGPVLSHSVDEPFVVTSPKIRKYGDTWYLAYTAGRRWIKAKDGRSEIIYKLRMATSKDGRTWSKLNRDLIEDKLGADEAQACPDILFSNGKYHMFYCYRHGLDFRDDVSRTYRIGYAHSRDLLNWTRADDQIEFDVSASGWDSEMVAYPTVFELDGQTYMLYAGNGVGKTGFGLAKLVGALN